MSFVDEPEEPEERDDTRWALRRLGCARNGKHPRGDPWGVCSDLDDAHWVARAGLPLSPSFHAVACRLGDAIERGALDDADFAKLAPLRDELSRLALEALRSMDGVTR